MENELLKRLNALEKRYKRLKLSFQLLTSLSIIAGLSLAFTQNNHFGIIRAKGIILEDEQGRDRILIGAPIPYSKNRVRTDTTLVRKHWSNAYKGMENQYMEWYKSYHNSAEGMVVLNEKGFDRVQIGDKLSDPNSGKRQFEVAGVLWNNPEGWELGGAGVNTGNDGKSRSVMGVDDGGGEAVHIVALEDGTKGLIIGGAQGRLMLGMSPKNGAWFQNHSPYTGFRFFNPTGQMVWEQVVDSLHF